MKRVCILLALLLTVCFFISCSNAPQIETDAVPQKVIGVPESLGKSLSEGTVQIDAKIEPAEASQALKWQSSDERIATVENGKITLLQEGVTVIIATSAKEESVFATCVLTVTQKEEGVMNEEDSITEKTDSGSRTIENIIPLQKQDYSTGKEWTGQKYYVSSSSGSDSNDGTSEEFPFKTIEKVNSLSLKQGDAIFFKCGDVWAGETITPKYNNSSGDFPIVFSSYGTGRYPAIISPDLTADEDYLLNDGQASVCVKFESVGGYELRGLYFSDAMLGVHLNNNKNVRLKNISIEDCYFRDINGYPTIENGQSVPLPFYSIAILLSSKNKSGALTNVAIRDVKIYDSAVGIHLAKVHGSMFLENIYLDNMYKEGITLEDCSFPQDSQGIIDGLTVCGTGCVEGMFWGTTHLQFSACRNIVARNCDLSYAGNYLNRIDMIGGDFEGTCENITVQDSYIHDNGGSAWLVFINPSWGQKNLNTSIENCVISNNGLYFEPDNAEYQGKGYPAFLRHYYNHDNGGSFCNNEIWLARESQTVNYINTNELLGEPPNRYEGGGEKLMTDEYPSGYTVQGNVVKGIYSNEDNNSDAVWKEDFSDAYFQSQWTSENGTSNGKYFVLHSGKLSGPALFETNGLTQLSMRIKNKTDAERAEIKFLYEDGTSSVVEFQVTLMEKSYTRYDVDIGGKLKKGKVVGLEVELVGFTKGYSLIDFIEIN